MSHFINKAIWLMVVILLVGAGCQGGDKSPVSPPAPTDEQGITRESDYSHVLWGMWEFRYDKNEEVTVLPVRELSAHFNVANMLLPPECNDCVSVTVNIFNPWQHILDIDVALTNPTPIAGRDVRGILYTDDSGHELTNADGWVGLYDIPGGITLNPFKAFAKAELNRVFAGLAQHTENFQIYIPSPPQLNSIKFAVDASWPGNCKEPFQISSFTQAKVYHGGGYNAEITVNVRDWQDNTNKVTLVAPQINGQDFTQFAHVSGNTWQLLIANSESAPAGDYEVRVIAQSPEPGGISMYNYFTLTVSEWGEPSAPQDLTPPWLNFQPLDTAVYGGMLYIAAGYHKLHVFDISNPAQPAWENMVETNGYAYAIAIDGHFAYVAEQGSGLDILDLSTPGQPVLVKAVSTIPEASDVKVSNGYAYVAASDGLYIIDVDPIESADVVITIPTTGNGTAVAIDGGYAYLGSYANGLEIIDIDPVDSASIINTVPVVNGGWHVEASGGYAYVSDYPTGIAVVDVDPPGSASIVTTVPTNGPGGMSIDGGNIYLSDGNSVTVFGLGNPALPNLVGSLDDLPGWNVNISTGGNYAYVANWEVGLLTVDISTPSSPGLSYTNYTPGSAEAAAISGDYAYVADWGGGVQVVNISDTSNAFVSNYLPITGYAIDIEALGNYAYLAAWGGGLDIIDISNGSFPVLIKNVTTTNSAAAVSVDNDYAYVAVGNEGFDIIDINPPGSASVIKNVPVPGYANDVLVHGEYAYVVTQTQGLQIVDITPPASASVVQTVALTDSGKKIAIDGNYAYIAANSQGLVIVDISAPLASYIANTVLVPWASGVAVTNGYAYASTGLVKIVDVDPVGSAYLYGQIVPSVPSNFMTIVGNYGYSGANGAPNGGFHIYQLW